MLLGAYRILPHSLRGYLLLLIVVTVLPAVLLSVYVAYQAYTQEKDAVERRLLESARTLSLVVDRQLGQAGAVLRTLASSPALIERDYAELHAQASKSLLDETSSITLVGDGNRLIMSTARPFEQALPVVKPPEEMVAALRTHELYISNLLSGIVGGDWVLLVALRLGPPGQALPRLVMSLPPESLNTILHDQQLPNSWNIAIVDREGTIVARSRRVEGFLGKPATETARAAIKTGIDGIFYSRALDGIESVGAFSRLPESGWTVIVSAPRAEVIAPANRLLLIAAICVPLVLIIGVALTAAISRIIVRAIERLVQDARAVGRGEIPSTRSTGLSDTQLVAETLRTSALRLKRGEEELLRLNETLEARVADATERLVASSRLEAVGRLTGGIAHDFNNLLAAIRINLDLVSRRFPDSKALDHARAARESTERGAKLVAQLLAFSRQQQLAPEPVDVNDVARTMAQMLRTTLNSVQLQLQLREDLPFALSDRTQLEMIIMNLAINARDAMPEGGTITLQTDRVRVDAVPARPEAPGPGEYVLLAVSDTGTGMSEEMLEQVLEPFFTTKEVGQGSGLGLSQVLGIVKQLGGGLRIDSQVGRGTRMEVFLPVVDHAPRPRQEVVEPAATAERFEHRCVLLVDDDDAVRQPICSLLEDLGCTVVAAASGAEALELARQGPDFDIALLDYAMPRMTGIELAARLREAGSVSRILLMTGYADAARLAESWTGPILRKPFDQDALARALEGELR